MTLAAITDETQLEMYLCRQAELNEQFNKDPIYAVGTELDELEERICEYLNKTRSFKGATIKSLARFLVQPNLMEIADRSGFDMDDVLGMLTELSEADSVFVTTDNIVVAGFEGRLIEAKEPDDDGVMKTHLTPYNRPIALPVCAEFWDFYGGSFPVELPIMTEEFIQSRMGTEPGDVRSFQVNDDDLTRIEKFVDENMVD